MVSCCTDADISLIEWKWLSFFDRTCTSVDGLVSERRNSIANSVFHKHRRPEISPATGLSVSGYIFVNLKK